MPGMAAKTAPRRAWHSAVSPKPDEKGRSGNGSSTSLTPALEIIHSRYFRVKMTAQYPALLPSRKGSARRNSDHGLDGALEHRQARRTGLSNCL
jgi:hypothetical protein